MQVRMENGRRTAAPDLASQGAINATVGAGPKKDFPGRDPGAGVVEANDIASESDRRTDTRVRP